MIEHLHDLLPTKKWMSFRLFYRWGKLQLRKVKYLSEGNSARRLQITVQIQAAQFQNSCPLLLGTTLSPCFYILYCLKCSFILKPTTTFLYLCLSVNIFLMVPASKASLAKKCALWMTKTINRCSSLHRKQFFKKQANKTVWGNYTRDLKEVYLSRIFRETEPKG